jgi:hypothetical protein
MGLKPRSPEFALHISDNFHLDKIFNITPKKKEEKKKKAGLSITYHTYPQPSHGIQQHFGNFLENCRLLQDFEESLPAAFHPLLGPALLAMPTQNMSLLSRIFAFG